MVGLLEVDVRRLARSEQGITHLMGVGLVAEIELHGSGQGGDAPVVLHPRGKRDLLADLWIDRVVCDPEHLQVRSDGFDPCGRIERTNVKGKNNPEVIYICDQYVGMSQGMKKKAKLVMIQQLGYTVDKKLVEI